MDNSDFRNWASGELSRLLIYWRTIEFWIKKAEQVNDSAIIPAINELRYASRQIFNAWRLLDKPDLNDGDKSAIRRRLTIGEQYLFNADHDIGDAITGFYKILCQKLDIEFGKSAIAVYFPDYPALREHVFVCLDLISEARHEYDKRAENYGKLRKDHFPKMLAAYRHLLDAEVSAKHERTRVQNELRRAQTRITVLRILNAIGSVASIIAVFLAFYFWIYAKEDFCVAHSNHLFDYICGRQSSPINSSAPKPP